jgi:membrane peptidoglycan carboxypeptidase
VPTPRFASKAGVVAQLAGLAVATGALVAAVAIPAVGFAGMAARDTAKNFNTMATPELGQIPVRSEILDRHGNVLAYYYGRGIDRVPVSYTQISPVMRQAIVAIEDSRFYQHGAIDFKGTVRAVINNLQHNPVQGGSTLAQQYVKNVLYLSSPNPQAAFAGATSETIGRKIRELRMAVRVEHQMSKNAILASYLNVAYFGSSAYGVEVAAERYFSTDASKLTLSQAALLAGLVENPTLYDPINNPKTALARRNQVLQRMVQVGDITQSAAGAAGRQPLGLNPSVLQKGCTSTSARYAGFFCDYVLASMKVDPEFKQAWQRLNGIGGLKIYTTLDPAVQRAARNAVNYMLPPPPSSVNPGKNAASEVIIQPGTGRVRAIAIDRPYGYGKHATVVNYAVGPQYNGGEGVQIGSTGKVYVMVTALEQGIPFGYSKNVGFSADVGGYTNCKGQPTAPWQVHNDESEPGGHYTLYTGTTFSINVFFAYLEQKVGLCNVVKTAAKMGLTWPDGKSLLKKDPRQGRDAISADNIPSFTLGAVNVAPIDVAASDAVLPARGIYCHPIVVTKIVTANGAKLPVESPKCHRVLSSEVADAANYILQGDLTGEGTAPGDAIGRPAAAKTGTADQYVSAFFVGYTPHLLGAVWVGNPAGSFRFPMSGYPGSCYRIECGGFMYGSMAPGQTWQMTFLHAPLGPPVSFVPVSPSSEFYSMGTGIAPTSIAKPKPKPKPHNGGGGGGNGNGNSNGNGNGGGGGG